MSLHRFHRAVVAGLLFAGLASADFKEKGRFAFGPGGATDYDDADIDAIEPCPFTRWPAPAKRTAWGAWLTQMLWESNYHIGDWHPLMSPEQIRLYERAGFDVLTVHADSESMLQQNCTLDIRGPGDPAPGIELGAEWVRRTGRGLIPTGLWMTDQGGCDGVVTLNQYGHARKPAGHSSICYSSPNTFRWTVRKIKGLREAFRDNATDDQGRFHAWWLKETSRYYYLRSDGSRFQLACYCPDCQAEFRRFVQRKYASLDAVGQAYGKKYHAWDEINLPVTENRFYEPQHYYDFILFREWIREANGERLWRRLGLTNVDNEGTFQFGAWYVSLFAGINAYRGSLLNDFVNLDFGGPFGPRAAIAAMTDSVLRNHPDKRALALWGGGPSLYLHRPGAFMRQIGAHFGHVTNMRGIQINGWDYSAGNKPWSYYYFPKYVPWVAKEVAWWSAFGELQADLLRGMKTVQPRIASYFARPSILFEALSLDHPDGTHPERSKAWAWNPMMFWQSHLPVHILHPEQVEQGDLAKYQVLYVLYGPRNTPESLARIEAFHDAGGYVYGAFDALTWTITEEDWSTVERVFKCAPLIKPDRHHMPAESNLKQRNYRWNSKFTEPLGYYEITAAHPALPPVGTRLPVTAAIRTVKPLAGGKVYATFNGEACIVGTERSLFVGTDIMSDIAHTVPRDYKAMSEPWQLNYPSLPREAFAHVLQVLTGFAEYAGVQPPFEVLQAGRRAWNIETGALAREDGTVLYTLGDNEHMGGVYDVVVSAPAGVEAADLVSRRRLPIREGRIALELPASGFAMLLLASPERLAQALQTQAEVDGRVAKVWDLELSRHFFVQYEANTAYDGLGYPSIWSGFGVDGQPRPPRLLPQAILVVPDKPGAEDLRLANRLRDLFHDFPVPAAGGVTNLGVTLVVKPASAVTEQELGTRNLLLIGGPRVNALAAKLLPSDELRRQAETAMFTTFRPNPDESGGNLLVIGGNPESREAAYEKLRLWAFTWFDGFNTPMAPDLLAAIAAEKLGVQGWKIEAKNALTIDAVQGSRRRRCVIYARGLTDDAVAATAFLERAAQGEILVICDRKASRQHFADLIKARGWTQPATFARADQAGR